MPQILLNSSLNLETVDSSSQYNLISYIHIMLHSNTQSNIMPSLVCLIVLYLHLHACYARPLAMTVNKENTVVQAQLYNKDSRFGTSLGIFGSDKISDGHRANKMTYSLKVSQETGEQKVQKRVERSILEFPQSSNTEKTLNSKENDNADDIVVTDYAQPHRKSPIHNKEV